VCLNTVELAYICIIKYSLERPNTGNLVTRVDHGWSSPLSPHEDDVNHLRCRRHSVHLFEVVDWHGDMLCLISMSYVNYFTTTEALFVVVCSLQ
jgi:hypothetical protein